MMKPEIQHIAVTQADGSLAIMLFVTQGHLDAGGTLFEREATDEAIADEMKKAGLTTTVWRRIDPEVPAERSFRAAWRDAGAIVVDTAIARDIHRERLREMRAPKLTALDVEYPGGG